MTVGKVLKNIRKGIVWGIMIIALLILTAMGIVLIGAQGYINKNLSGFVNKKTNGLYSLDFERIELSIKNRGFTITGLELKPNEAKAKEIQNKNPERVFYSLSASELQIHRLLPYRIYSEKKLILDKISLVKPEFALSGSFTFMQDSVKPFDYAMVEVRDLFNKYLNEIRINEIEFTDANYEFYALVGDTSNFSNAEKISIGITDFRTDSTLLESKDYPFEMDDIFIRMNNFRNEMSDSIHYLAIESLEYSHKKAELSAFNTHLYPKKIIETKSLYDIQVPSFVVKSRSLSTIYTADSLFIDHCQFDNPSFKFYQKKNFEKVNIEDVNNFDLYSLIENDFEAIHVDTFLLNKASLEISRQAIDTSFQQKFDNIDVQLYNFTLDASSNKNPDKLLLANNIDMKITGYLLHLNDNIHRFKADTVYVSTLANQISVKGLKIDADQSINIDNNVVLNIACNELSFNDVDLKNTYHRRKLACNFVHVVKPEAQLDYPANYKRNPGKGQSGLLFDIVSSYLKGVYSNLVEIKDGSLKIQNTKNKRVTGFFETDFAFGLTDFALDSTSLEDNDKLFYASNFDLNFSNYSMKLVDNLHQLSVKNILVSSYQSKAIIDSLSLRPILNNVDEEKIKRFKRSETYSLFVPKISILNADLHSAFFEKKLRINSLRFYEPAIYFENFAYLKKGRNKDGFSELYQLIFNYVDDISIKNAAIPNGEVTWINHTKSNKSTRLSNKFDIELKDFRLNNSELDQKKLLFSENINLSLRDQLFKLSDNVHYLQADEINFSTEQSSVRFTNALFYPDITSPDYISKPTTFQFSLPSLSLEGVDIRKAYYSRNIDVKNIVATNPKFEVYSQKGKTKPLDIKEFSIPLPTIINILKVGNLQISNGNVLTYQLLNKSPLQTSTFILDLQSEGISLSQKSPFKTIDINATLSNFRLNLWEKAHQINVDKIAYDKKLKTIDFTNLTVKPSTNKTAGNKFNFKFPSIQFKGFGTDLAYKNNIYEFSTIEVDHPGFSIQLNDTIKSGGLKKLRELDFYPYVEPYVNQLNIGILSLNNAKVDFQSIAKGLKHENINIHLKNIIIGENQPNKRLLNANEIEFVTYNLKRNSRNNRYTFAVDTLKYSSSKKSLELLDIQIFPKYSRKELANLAGLQTDVLQSEIKYLKLYDMNIDKWLTDKIVDAGSLQIGPSSSTVFRDKSFPFDESQTPPWPQKLISSLPYRILFDSVIVNPASITYSELLEISDEPASITFTNTQARIGQISNLPSQIKTNPFVKIRASSIINQKAKLEASFAFDLSSTNFSHSIQGSIKPVPMTIFNDFTEKAALVRVKEGQMNKFRFELDLNEQIATGYIWFAYDDFKISVIEFEDGKIKKEGFASLMANSLLVNSKNPRGKELEPESISYQRDPRRSVLNFWWKAIFSGAKKSMGIKEKKK